LLSETLGNDGSGRLQKNHAFEGDGLKRPFVKNPQSRALQAREKPEKRNRRSLHYAPPDFL
jgi:hypothetical protein